MSVQTLQLHSLSDLRQYVYNTLCEQNELEPGAYQLTERILVRSGEPCGIHFCLHGPRSVKLTAIWETDGNTILFYACSGERRLRAQLTTAPVLEPIAV